MDAHESGGPIGSPNTAIALGECAHDLFTFLLGIPDDIEIYPRPLLWFFLRNGDERQTIQHDWIREAMELDAFAR